MIYVAASQLPPFASRPFNICSRLRSSVIAIAVHRKEDVDLLVLQRISRDQLLAEIWGGEPAEQNVPEKIESEPEHDRCEPAVAQKKPALEYVGEIKRLDR